MPASPSRAASLNAALTAAEGGDYSGALALVRVADGSGRAQGHSVDVAEGWRLHLWGHFRLHHRQLGLAASNHLRRAAEQALTGNEDPGRLLSWFGANPPLTTGGKVALAGAFLARGNTAEAARAARTAWVEGRFSQGRRAISSPALGVSWTKRPIRRGCHPCCLMSG